MIDSYSFGQVVVDGNSYNDDIIIFPDRVKDGWWRKEGHSLHPEDLDEVIEAGPDVLIVGTGAYGRMDIPDETREFIENKGIKIIAQNSKKATQKYNEISDKNKTVAALHLTC